MKILKASMAGCAVALLAAACGGSTDSTGRGAPANATRLLASSSSVVPTPASPADYTTVAQQLYVAYFGRPADPVGMSHFAEALYSAGAPTELQGLVSAYATNPVVRSLIDTFGTSAESQSLYSGDNLAFVNAIFLNLLNRNARLEGLTFWASALDNGALTRGNAALAITGGALSNTSEQGMIDARVVMNKTIVASSFTTSLDTGAEIAGYSGPTVAAQARALLQMVTEATDVETFKPTLEDLQLPCDYRTSVLACPTPY